MSNDINGIVNMDYIVKRVLMDLDDDSMRNYKKFLQWVIDGYTTLNLFTMQNVKVAYLPVNSNNTVNLPVDYMDYTKIGFESNGKIVTFGHNEDLILPREKDDCGNIVNDNTGGCDSDDAILPNYGYFFAPHFRNGQYVGELYAGAGGGNSDGEYRIDLEKRQIAFNSDIAASVVILEYKSAGVSGDGSTFVPRQCVPALIAFVKWQRKENNDKESLGAKDRVFRLYDMEYEKLRDIEFSFTIEEYLASRRSTYSSIPKR
jgi:hypothetical protein